ncbi:hypothetical protein [Sphingopyxis sp. KK2]|uniref:hypothetical protein n=1 Tax=Sphingopyxis sp. KK2 TaxID=1855727 RepID=UPI00097E6C33|nr:hypothetical protein [Sphingopyxis sp. KK2]
MWRLIPLALLATLVGGCDDGCGNEIITRSDATGGAHSAVMFNRNCGATTGFTTQISIVPSGEQPSGAGNAFVADDDHGAATTGDWGGPWAEMTWLAPDHLRIRYVPKSRLFKQEENVSDVKISYEPVAR